MLQAVTNQEVINSPAGIVNFAGLNPLRPPGVGPGDIPMQVAKRIYEALV